MAGCVTALGFDHEDILLMLAPRPVLVLATKYDFFPIEGTRSTVGRVKRFWEMYGKPDRLELYEDAAPHEYNRNMAKKAAEFFSIHLLGKNASFKDEAIKPVTLELLNCTEHGQIRAELKGSRAVYEENCDCLAELEARRRKQPEEERRQRAAEWLRERVLGCRQNL